MPLSQVRHYLGRTVAVIAGFCVAILFGLVLNSLPGRAASTNDQAAQIQIGFAVAPVPLNLVGKSHDLVGLGSFIVNVKSDCTDATR
jgi:hypothetical protein